MINCCQREGIDKQFGKKITDSELKRYRKKGPRKTTKLLINALSENDIKNKTLLDIGGGLGLISFELFKKDLKYSILVDLSSSYLSHSKTEAQRLNLSDKIQTMEGDYVELSATIEPVDIVVLDKVICCYPDLEPLLLSSLTKSKYLYGLVYPHKSFYSTTLSRIMNLFLQLFGKSFRIYIHLDDEVEKIIKQNGFKKTFTGRWFVWNVCLYEKGL